jgi:transposase
MGKRKRRQQTMWVAASDLPMSPGHPFYAKLNRTLDAAGFDAYVEGRCRQFYAPVLGRPGLSPGRYFRLLLVGYFEGLDSERGMAWRAADSLAIRSFLGLCLEESAPDHSTISRNRRLIDVETHREVFTWIQERLAESGLLSGKTVSIDATTLEANAAMRSIVRRQTGETYPEFLKRLAKSSGVRTPSREALARLDRRRRRKGSNEEWTSPADPDAKITRMKDGRTHLAHKAEHAVDMATGAIVAVTIQRRGQGRYHDPEEHTRASRASDRDGVEPDRRLPHGGPAGGGGGQGLSQHLRTDGSRGFRPSFLRGRARPRKTAVA